MVGRPAEQRDPGLHRPPSPALSQKSSCVPVNSCTAPIHVGRITHQPAANLSIPCLRNRKTCRLSWLFQTLFMTDSLSIESDTRPDRDRDSTGTQKDANKVAQLANPLTRQCFHFSSVNFLSTIASCKPQIPQPRMLRRDVVNTTPRVVDDALTARSNDDSALGPEVLQLALNSSRARARCDCSNNHSLSQHDYVC